MLRTSKNDSQRKENLLKDTRESVNRGSVGSKSRDVQYWGLLFLEGHFMIEERA